MYRFTPDEVDHECAHHQAVDQGAEDPGIKRIGNLGEFVFEQLCRESVSVEMWGVGKQGNDPPGAGFRSIREG